MAAAAARAGFSGSPSTATWEATNLVTVAAALVAAAWRREETRGSHWREDFPHARPEWVGHFLARIDESEQLEETWERM